MRRDCRSGRRSSWVRIGSFGSGWCRYHSWSDWWWWFHFDHNHGLAYHNHSASLVRSTFLENPADRILLRWAGMWWVTPCMTSALLDDLRCAAHTPLHENSNRQPGIAGDNDQINPDGTPKWLFNEASGNMTIILGHLHSFTHDMMLTTWQFKHYTARPGTQKLFSWIGNWLCSSKRQMATKNNKTIKTWFSAWIGVRQQYFCVFSSHQEDLPLFNWCSGGTVQTNPLAINWKFNCDSRSSLGGKSDCPGIT